MGFIDDLANSKTTESGNGAFFKPGKGTVIVKDVKIFDGFGDRKFKLSTIVKASKKAHPTEDPNPVGEETVVIQPLAKPGAKGRVKAILLAILGPDVDQTKLDAEITELLRADDNGFTRSGTECPVRGMELKYETYEVTTDAGKKITAVEFTHVPYDEATFSANRVALDGGA